MQKWISLLVVAAVGSTGSALAATVSNMSPTVSQNFDTLPSSGDTPFSTWSALTGQGWATSLSNATILANSGTDPGAANRLFSYGTGSSTDRALGSQAVNSSVSVGSSLFFGLPITNGGTTAITELSIGYTGEQWRANNNTSGVPVQTLAFSFGVGATGINSGTFTSVPHLTFSSLFNTVPGFGGAGSLDGNAAANRTVLSTVISGLSIAPGETVWLRWADTNDTGNDHGLAIDDFSLTARFAPETPVIPLPAAAVAGPGLMAAGLLRRRR